MTPNQLHDLLDDFASTEIPDDMNLLKDIEARLQTMPAVSVRPVLRFSRAAAVLVVLMFATIAYAVYQSQLNLGDTGIVTADSQELVTVLGLTEKHPDADVNILIPWAYADGNRIAIGWEVDYALTYKQPYVQSVSLLDADGNPFSGASFLYGGGGGGGSDDIRATFGSSTSWDATSITGDPETLDLTLVISLSDQPSPMMGGGGSGGGGGGGESSATPAELLPVALYEARFDFTLPFIPAAQPSENSITVTAGGIPITLSDIRYAPSVIIGKLCLPIDISQTHHPRLARQENTVVQLDFSYQSTPSEDGQTACQDITIMGILADEDGVLRLTMERLVNLIGDWDMSDERFNAFLAAVEAEGFKTEVVVERNSDGGFDIIISDQHQTGENPMEIHLRVQALAEEYLADNIFGPWVFEIDLR